MLDEAGLARQAALGEDSSHRFLAASADEQTLACEMAAFANAAGGLIFWGIEAEADGGEAGIARAELGAANARLLRAAQSLVPPQAVHSTNLALGEGRLVIVVQVAKSRRPVRDPQGQLWVKVAAGRVVVSPEDWEAQGAPAVQCVPGVPGEQGAQAQPAVVSAVRAGEEKTGAAATPQPAAHVAETAAAPASETDEKNFSDFDPDSPVAMEAREVYRLMKNDITVTIGGLADIIGLSKRTILKRVALLKDLGVLVRKGSSRGGAWILVPEKAVACGLTNESECQVVDAHDKNG